MKPTSGFFAALTQFSVGIRNILRNDAFDGCFPLRLQRPRENKILPFSPSRASGYLISKRHFGEDVKFVMNEVAQLELNQPNNVKLLLVSTLIITDHWIVACRETFLDTWAIPLEIVENISLRGRSATFSALNEHYILNFRTSVDALALRDAIDFADRLRTGKLSRNESFYETNKIKLRSSSSFYWDSQSVRSLSFRRSARQRESTGGNELDVVGVRIGSAEIQSFGKWPDGIVRYRILLTSSDNNIQWAIERRYNEFVLFRDQACAFLSVSRRSMPLPGKRPWILSIGETEYRIKGLQKLLRLALTIALLADSEVLREFLTRGADHVTIISNPFT